MKNRTTSIVVALALGACASAVAQTDDEQQRVEKVNSLYQMGMVAMKEGNFDLAKTSFKEVMRLNPSHAKARMHLYDISINRNAMSIGRRKAALKKVIIPQVNLDKATIQESLEMLAVQVERESKKKVTPNFIVQDPTGGFKGRTVTLRLSRIPAETLLRYIVDQASGHVRFDNHAIVITPRKPGKAAEPTAEDAAIVK